MEHRQNTGQSLQAGGGYEQAPRAQYAQPSSSLQQGRQSPLPSPVRTSFHFPAHSESQTSFLAPAQSVVRPLDLGFHPSNSQTSLLEAVVGPAKTAQATLGSASSAYPQPSRQAQPSSFNTSRKPAPSAEERRVPSDSSKSYGTSTEREWDVLSDASLKLNEGEGDEKAVEELQKKVNRRRSKLPHLESELAQLEAQIKATEERLARAQGLGAGQARP